MLDGHLHALRQVGDNQFDWRLAAVEKRKRLAARLYDRCGEPFLLLTGETGALSDKFNDGRNPGEQPGIVVQGHFSLGGISGHWFPRAGRRMPRGSPGNNTTHPRRDEYFAVIGRNSSISRRCTGFPACHTASRRSSLAWLSPEIHFTS